MKTITEYLSTKVAQTKIKATDDTIQQIVKDELDRLGHDADLNHIDVSEVTSLLHVFNPNQLGSRDEHYKDINPDVSRWDVSNVTHMHYAFACANKFNGDISDWDVSNVIKTEGMFFECWNFNCNIGNWNVSKVECMNSMFCGCGKFNQDLSRWDVRNVRDMVNIFMGCRNFNQDLSQWDVSNLKMLKYKTVNLEKRVLSLFFEGCDINKDFIPNLLKPYL